MNDRSVSNAGGIFNSSSGANSLNVHTNGQPPASIREFVLSAMLDCGIRECEPSVVNQLCEFVQGNRLITLFC